MTTIPLEDTICKCNHWYEEHNHGDVCEAPDCHCGGFSFDSEGSTPEAIADRGGDPDLWPEHVKRAFQL
jgi:hypothetical protein